LARVAVSEADPELAREYFQQTLESSPDPAIESMSHVYIGRIEDIMGNRQEALRQYKLALEVRGIPGPARELAEKGLKEQFQSPRQQQEAEEQETDEEPAQETTPKRLQ
jgi:hypothetical protein